MIRGGAFFALVALCTFSVVVLDVAEGAMPLAASPTAFSATPIAYAVGEMPGAAPVSMLIQNRGTVDDRLIGANTPAAERAEIHTSELNNGMRRMLPAPDGIAVPAGGTLILEPASDHVMIAGLRDDLVQGRTFPLTLHFARAGDVTVAVRVRRKVDAAGLTPVPAALAGDISLSLASVPPAPAPSSAMLPDS